MIPSLILIACLTSPAEPTLDLVETASKAGGFQLLLTAAERAGLMDALKSADDLTILAPTDDAFKRLPEGLLDKLLLKENRTSLESLLKYHILPGSKSAAALIESGAAKTLEGRSVAFGFKEGRLRAGAAQVLKNDIVARNGVIHVIDQVLIPNGFEIPAAAESPAALIELAVSRGAPLFNDGNPAACAAIYEVAARSLLLAEPGQVKERSRAAMKKALDQAADERDPARKAWALRNALDAVYAEVAPREKSASAPKSDIRLTSLFEFERNSPQASSTWNSVNDNVMGGISKGGMRSIDGGLASFQGALSLANNGGFSTARSPSSDLGLAGHEGLVIRVRGDGRTYAVSALRSDGSGTIRTWRRDFETRSGEWQEIRVPFSEMQLSIMGRRFPGNVIDPSGIRSLAFSIADKNEAPFRLDVDWIRAYRPGNSSF